MAVNCLFKSVGKCDHPRRILIEGATGTGKTILCKYLLHQWDQEANVFPENIRMVFKIDLRKGHSLKDAMFQQNVPTNFRLTKDELWHIVVVNQHDVLFILDGYDSLTTLDPDVEKLLSKKIMKRSALILLSSLRLLPPILLQHFDSRLVILGLQQTKPAQLVKKYTSVIKNFSEYFSDLIIRMDFDYEEYDAQLRSLAQHPFFCLCICAIVELREDYEVSTPTQLMQDMVYTLQHLFCQRHGIKLMEGGEVPYEVQDTIQQLEEIAYDGIMNKRMLFPMEELQKRYLNPWLFSMGILQKGSSSSKGSADDYCSFACKLLQEFLAARHLARKEPHELHQHLDTLVSTTSLQQVCAFFCGLVKEITDDYEEEEPEDEEMDQEDVPAPPMTPKTPENPPENIGEDDTETEGRASESPKNDTYIPNTFRTILQRMFQKYADRNCNLKNSFSVKSTDSNHSILSKTEGRLLNLQGCLESLAESDGDEYFADILVQTFPSKIYMRSRDVVSALAYQGLAHILRIDPVTITELSLRLDTISKYTDTALSELAMGLAQNTKVQKLKLVWTVKDLLVQFLNGVFQENAGVHHLVCIDESKAGDCRLSATIWDDLHSACRKMLQVRTFAFAGCRNPTLVGAVLHNLPSNIEKLDLTGCDINTTGADELSEKFGRNDSLKLLDLTSIRLESTIILTLTKGLKINKTLSHLIMRDTQIDTGGVASLSEAIKFNKGLRSLDLSRNDLNSEACRILAYALSMNRGLAEVAIKGSKRLADGNLHTTILQKEEILGMFGIKRDMRSSSASLNSGRNSYVRLM